MAHILEIITWLAYRLYLIPGTIEQIDKYDLRTTHVEL
jgi:hypothetical protein